MHGAVRSIRVRSRRAPSQAARLSVAALIVVATAIASPASPARGADCAVDRLFASPDESFAEFGSTVSIRGGVAVAGAPFHDLGPFEIGTAYVFRWSGLAWTAEATLTPTGGNDLDQFGHAVATDGAVIIVGATLHEVAGQAGAGAAYVFRFDGIAWRPEQVLTAPAPAPADSFGWSVAVAGDVAVVGALRDDEAGLDAGAAYVYRFDGQAWAFEQKVFATDTAAQDRFAWSIALDGQTLLVGAPLDDDLGAASGSAYVFQYDGATWVQQSKLTAPGGAASDRFGSSVAIAGDVALVGAPLDDDQGSASGSACVFRQGGATWNWEQTITATGGGAFDNFGWSVAIEGAVAAVGAWQDTTSAGMSGSVAVFRRTGGAWSQRRTLLGESADDGDGFGFALAIDGSAMLASALSDDGPGAAAAGTVSIFDLQACLCAADLDGSGAVNIADLLTLLSAWGAAANGDDADIAPFPQPDGTVDAADLMALLGTWGTCRE